MTPSSDNNNVHRPGALKQQNKKFKTGRHRSQHEIKRSTKGRVAENKHARSLKRLNITSKQDRVNAAIQLRKQKLQANKQARQTIGAIDGVPQIITVIPLSSDVNVFSIVELITSSINDQKSSDQATDCGARIYTCPKLRSKFCFLTPTVTNLENILDCAKMSDTIIYIISSSTGLSIEGDYLIDLINIHCLPQSIIYSVISSSNDDNMSTISSTSKVSSFKNLEKFLEKKFSDVKLTPLDNQQDAQRLLNKLTQQKLIKISKKFQRPYLFAQTFSYENPKSSKSTLKLSGYLRGTHLSPNDLVYIPNLGTFQLEKIEEHRFQRDSDGILKPIVEKNYLPDKDLQRSLSFEAEQDPMNYDEEQTWPTKEEIDKAKHQLKKRVPKGTSQYQAAWILSDDEDDNSEKQQNDLNDNEHDMMDDYADDLHSIQLDQADKQDEDEEEEEEEEMEEVEMNPNNYDEKYDLEEDKQTLKQIKDAKLDEQFPDEIDTPMDVPARVRFQKYRGLKSFRTTKWDVKENLPSDYGRIYQFPNFRAMIKQIQNEQDNNQITQDHAPVHSYVTLYVKDVPVTRFEPGYHLFSTGLLPYEQCLSVLNIVLNRTNDSEIILKSKERLIFHVGFRRFASSPIYSQHTNGDKHKFERYFRAHQTLVATCFGPITYPPASVLAFKEYPDGRQELVATGSVLSVNPDRVTLKRIVISGHPFKIHKRSAVIRYMFFNPDDINWFKPIELRTRWGRRGHIKESLGTHGHMKCQFDGILKSQDTIFMNLYKRIYPKWTYEPLSIQQQQKEKETNEEHIMQ
ncbi:unnamed protein product [Rotaria socialis]|uniref:Pre-rRNA-processing protein TSR1 homolog n=1 Tax=Rotaria socialis TaxID=392032 RepID=A0A817LKI6_9BILA|nr:unnamed protein product [Rotaria socialis]CAF4251782.1 unnamed protein product [Rotaria socialis]